MHESKEWPSSVNPPRSGKRRRKGKAKKVAAGSAGAAICGGGELLPGTCPEVDSECSNGGFPQFGASSKIARAAVGKEAKLSDKKVKKWSGEDGRSLSDDDGVVPVADEGGGAPGLAEASKPPAAARGRSEAEKWLGERGAAAAAVRRGAVGGLVP